MMELDLNDIVWPICLLKCNTALNGLRGGEELTLIVKDTDLISHLTRIIDSYGNLDHEITEFGDSFRIIVACDGGPEDSIRSRKKKKQRSDY
jgi:TusA-related sulfurtransferase